MSSVASALIGELSDGDLDRLADLLAPRILARQEPPDDRWLRGAAAISEYIGAPRSRTYALSAAGRIPVERDGSNLVARRSVLDAWLLSGGARRP